MEVHSILSEAQMQALVAQHGRTDRPVPPYPILFPAPLLAQATEHLRVNGRIRHEQLVLWGGYALPQGVLLTSLLMPATEATWGWVHVLPPEQPQIATWLRGHGQLLFVEAHTHGSGLRATELSDEDRRHPAGRQDGFLTLIVPEYARDGIDFSRAGVWECRALSWSRVPPREVCVRLHVISDEEAQRVIG